MGRVIVGGSAHTVSMGGYTLGGGHAPICRMFGMAVDNLLEVEMVTANGSLVYADENSTRLAYIKSLRSPRTISLYNLIIFKSAC